MDNDQTPTVDICGKRTLDYVIQSLAYLNRNTKDRLITIRGVGCNASKVTAVTQILVNEFGLSVLSSELRPLEIDEKQAPCLTIKLKGRPAESLSNVPPR